MRHQVLAGRQLRLDRDPVDLQKPVEKQARHDCRDSNPGKIGGQGSLAQFLADDSHAADIAGRTGKQEDEHGTGRNACQQKSGNPLSAKLASTEAAKSQ